MKTTIAIIVVALLAVAGFFTYKYYHPTVDDNGNVVACTMEAKLCPDGSYVGRQGPKCEFATCPNSGASVNASGTIEVNI